MRTLNQHGQPIFGKGRFATYSIEEIPLPGRCRVCGAAVRLAWKGQHEAVWLDAEGGKHECNS